MTARLYLATECFCTAALAMVEDKQGKKKQNTFPMITTFPSLEPHFCQLPGPAAAGYIGSSQVAHPALHVLLAACQERHGKPSACPGLYNSGFPLAACCCKCSWGLWPCSQPGLTPTTFHQWHSLASFTLLHGWHWFSCTYSPP